MKKFFHKLILTSLLLAILLSVSLPSFSATEREEEILFISSYNGSFPTWYNQLSGIKEVLKNDYVLDVEVMDSKRFFDPEYLQIVDSLFRYKYENRWKPDAVIVGDDNAFNYVMDNQDKLFKDIPIIFIGVNTIESAVRADSLPNITGFVESLSMEDTINMGLKLLPDTSRIVYIVDDTPTGRGQLQNFNNIKMKYEKDYTIKPLLLKDLSFEDLIKEISEFKQTDMVLLLSANLDKNGVRINFNDVVDIVNQNSPVPVFHLWGYGVGDGLAGGKLISHYKYGVEAATLLKEILEGKKEIKDIKVVTESDNDYIYDYEVLNKYNIDLGILPEGTILLNHPVNRDEAIERYQYIIIPVVLIILVLTVFVSILLFNINERKKYEVQIREMAFFDKQTGLPNRISLKEELTREISARRPGALISFDIDNFKNINDAYGHTIGDDVLIEAGKLLKKNLGNENFLAKMEGDEFIILLKNQKEKDKVLFYIKDLLTQINEKIIIGPYSFYITFSIGVCIYPDEGDNFETLFMNGEMALYKAKEYGKNTIVFYEDSFNEGLKEKLNLQYELMDALKNNEMYLCFQPKYLVNENKIVNYEALLRWESKKLGSVSPAVFIEVAEEMGLITEIGKFVLEESCKFIKYMEENGYKAGVSVNVSPNELNREDYVATIISIIEKHEVNCQQIGLELTESVLIKNFVKVKKILETMSSFGVKILLDDFGKGYSSLNYIRNLPINTLKIDKTFIDKIEDSEEDRVMIKAIIDIAQVNGMNVIAEGVEKEEQLQILKNLNCDAIQGFLIAQPLVLEEVIESTNSIIRRRKEE